jgi:hypothetical protein
MSVLHRREMAKCKCGVSGRKKKWWIHFCLTEGTEFQYRKLTWLLLFQLWTFSRIQLFSLRRPWTMFRPVPPSTQTGENFGRSIEHGKRVALKQNFLAWHSSN